MLDLPARVRAASTAVFDCCSSACVVYRDGRSPRTDAQRSAADWLAVRLSGRPGSTLPADDYNNLFAGPATGREAERRKQTIFDVISYEWVRSNMRVLPSCTGCLTRSGPGRCRTVSLEPDV